MPTDTVSPNLAKLFFLYNRVVPPEFLAELGVGSNTHYGGFLKRKYETTEQPNWSETLALLRAAATSMFPCLRGFKGFPASEIRAFESAAQAVVTAGDSSLSCEEPLIRLFEAHWALHLTIHKPSNEIAGSQVHVHLQEFGHLLDRTIFYYDIPWMKKAQGQKRPK